MAQAKKAKTNDGMGKAMELTQDTAKATLNGAVQTAELTEDYIQGVYKAAYDANYQGLKVAKNYWDAMSEIRQDWIKLFGETGESMIDATAKMEIPSIKDVTGFGKGVYKTVTKTVGNITPQIRTASK